jgi:hypothetical protein
VTAGRPPVAAGGMAAGNADGPPAAAGPQPDGEVCAPRIATAVRRQRPVK